MRRLLGRGVPLGLALGMLGIVIALNPEDNRLFPPCPFHYATGYYCPGCGSLRAIHNLFHGRIVEALSLNPLMVLSIPIILLMLLRPSWAYKPWVPWACVAILVCYGIARNLPMWPCLLLAPE